jgi:hypothetical protein
MMSYLRRASTRSLLFGIVGMCAVAVGSAAFALAASDGGPTPPPEPLDQAIQGALSAPHPEGVSARVSFTNNLFPSGGLLGQTGSALLTGADGRLWLTGAGQGRIELQSDAGDVQIVWNEDDVSLYDASSNTVYHATLPATTDQGGSTSGDTPPALSEIDSFLTNLGLHWALSDAQPTDVAGQPAYSVTASPKESGGLVGSLELAWDAVYGAPLEAGIYARGSTAPALQLAVSNIDYGPVSTDDVAIAPPAGAKVVELSLPSSDSTDTGAQPVTGLAAVTAAAPFSVVAPETLDGQTRGDVRLIGGNTVVATYGQGLGALALVERASDTTGSGSDLLANAPTVSLGTVTAHELATELGTILEWETAGTTFVLAGSVSAPDAEAAARTLQ